MPHKVGRNGNVYLFPSHLSALEQIGALLNKSVAQLLTESIDTAGIIPVEGNREDSLESPK